MVAIINGARPGLELSSLFTLGAGGAAGQAAEGRNGQRVYVDGASGNLVVQQRDELLVARGEDAPVLRTYNSRGVFDADTDNWHSAPESLKLAGTVNAAGSTVSRFGRDGSFAVYTYDAARALYVSSEGAGAFDTIRYVAADAQYEWADGDTGLVQRYEGTGALRVLSARDTAGNTLAYGYNAAGQLASVTTASGETTWYDYTGANLAQVRTVAGGVTTTRVRYGYDTSNRLASVTVDLSPADNAIIDGNTYQTTYTYDGTSKRIASITQSDGKRLAFSYVDAGAGVFMVSSVTDALNQVTSFAYTLAAPGVASAAVVTDALGQVTRCTYDTAGQLLSVTGPAVNGVSATRQFTYTATGDVASATDGNGQVTVFQYDANGNQLLQRDAAGNTVTRSFDARNQLLVETAYTTPDPDGSGLAQPANPLTTRYVYDATGRNQLRFVVGADGRVTEHRYDAYGQLASSIAYGGSLYPVAGLGASTPLAESSLASWAATTSPAANQRVDFGYDARGQLKTRTAYGKLDAAGNGIAGDASNSVEQYVRDPAGLLLQTISGTGASTTFTYDGLGRVLSTTDALGQVTLTRYSDTGNKTTVTAANGLVTTASYDLAGRVVSELSAGGGLSASTQYVYDAADRLRMTVDPTGVRAWVLYDAAGRKTAEVDGNGTMREYSYDAADHVTRVVAWGTAVNTAALVDAAGQPVFSATVDTIRPLASTADQATWRQYDAAGRLVREAVQVGTLSRAAVTETRYDGASRVLQVIRYGNTIPADGTAGSPTAGAVPLPAASSVDRSTRSFYDGEGHLAGTLDAEGYLTVLNYTAAGQLAERVRYANVTASTLRAAGTLAQLVPAATADDIREVMLYDLRGQLVAEVDGEKYLTEHVYDAAGRRTKTVRYATPLTAVVSPTSTVGSLRPATNAADRATTLAYDALGRVKQETSPEGVVTQYAYDTAGKLVSTTRAAATTEQRVLLARYDLMGRLTGELSAEGAALLVAGQTQAQVDAVWAQYGSTHSYDAAGRRTSTRDPAGNVTWFYYDADGALRYSIDALGEVRENRYDARGRLVQQVVYWATTGLRGPGGLLGASLAVTATAGLDAVSSLSYTREDLLASRNDAENYRTALGYNVFGELITRNQTLGGGKQLSENFVVDRRGLQTAWGRDSTGVNALTSTNYDAFGRATRTVDANGNAREQKYDRLGRTVLLRDPSNASRVTTYDAFGRELSETDELGSVTTYAYDTAARSVTVTTPEGVKTVTVRNRHGEIQSITDGNGQVTSYTYDLDGRLKRTSNPVASTSTLYRTDGLVQETTDAAGNKVAYTYDTAGRVLTRTVDPAGLKLATTYTYNARGDQISVKDANGVTTSVAYDREGRVLTRTVDPGGLNLRTTYTYDGEDRILTVTTPAGTVTQYTYDLLGRRIQERVDPAGLNLQRSWSYDREGNVLASTDARGNVTRYTYDAAGRRVFTLDAAGDVEKLDYDAAGRVLKTTRFATPIDLTALPAPLTSADLQLRVASDPGHDAVEHRVYDKDDRLAATVDGMGGVVRYTYDGNGNVVTRRAYAARIDLGTWAAGTMPAVVADPDRDQRVSTVYDALNRPVYTLDGAGGVVFLRYDGNGNVVERTAYAAAIDPATALSAVGATVAARVDPARDASVRYTYDAAGRLAWSVDGTGAVTRRVRDGNGNVVQQIAYAAPVATGAQPASVASGSGDRITSRAFDAANRMVFEIDALNAVTEQAYDADGRVTRRAAYAQTLVSVPPLGTSASESLVRAAVVKSPGRDRVERFGYDAAGRQQVAIDAEGAMTELQFDGTGQVVARTAYATPVDASATSSTASAATLRALLPAGASSRTTSYHYDAAGRLDQETDPLLSVKTTAYDGTGRVLQTGLIGRQESYGYNAAGQRVLVRDALGATESYGYDAVGRNLQFTNKNGATWTYEYDAEGRRVREVSPQVWLSYTYIDYVLVQSFDGGGEWYMPTERQGWHNESITTLLRYDALGHLTERTEAAGRTGEERTTSYEYDAAGRQVGVAYPTVSFYDPAKDKPETNGATGNAVRAENTKKPETHTYYDTLGNAVANRDVGGGLGQKVYDRMGRVLYEVDAAGYVTGYVRNAFGEATSLTRYGMGTTLAGRTLTSAAQAASKSEVDAVLAGVTFSHATDRTLQSSYDRAGRVVEVLQPSAFAYNPDPAAVLATAASARTRTTYDAFGEAVQVSTARDSDGTSWTTTTHYFDAGSRETGTVDALGYLTTRQFDAAGNLVASTEFATALQPGTWSAVAYAAAAVSAKDRSTRFTYDALNRKTGETLVSLEVGMGVDGIAAGRADATTSFTYDAVGNQVAVCDANGNTTPTQYDALGRISMLAGPMSKASSDPVALTAFDRDAHGNVVRQTQYANGALRVPDGIRFEPAAPDATKDRVTRTRFDASGHALEVTDANNHISYASYDIFGRVAKTWRNVTGADGALRTAFQVNTYDAVGQLVAATTPASTMTVKGGLFATLGYEPGTSLFNGVPYLKLDWSDLIDMQGGTVRAEVTVIDQWAQLSTVVQEFAASSSGGGVTVTLNVKRPVVQSFRVLQMVGTVPVLKWQGTMADATGGSALNLSQAQAGLVQNRLEYNAFGELTRNGSEYFEYDNAGHVWRTNSGDGVDRVQLHDLAGNVTAEIRSDGSGGADVDVTTFLTAGAAASSQNTRRVETVYDALGHVVQRTEAARAQAEQQGGVSVRKQSASARLVPSTYFSFTTSAALTWTSLADLGSGDLRVTLNYVNGIGTQLSYTSALLDAGAAATGATLVLPGDPYGITGITWLKIEKKTIEGNWSTMFDHAPNYESNDIRVAAPTDTRGALRLQLKLAGQATWSDEPLASFGDGYRFDARNLPTGTHEYRVLVKPEGHDESTVSSGSVSITMPPLAVIDAQLAYLGSRVPQGSFWNWVTVPDGVLSWTKPASGQRQEFRCRPAGSAGPWQVLPVQIGEFETDAVATSGLADGAWQFELLWLSAATGVPESHATGSFSVQHAKAATSTTPALPESYSVTVSTAAGSPAISTLDGAQIGLAAGLNGGSTLERPVLKQQTDRWGNVLSKKDPRSEQWQTTYRYNARNQLVEQVLPLATGQFLASATRLYYDALGQQVAVLDARATVNRQEYDAAGHLVRELHADTGSVRHVYDALGQKVQTTDAMGKVTRYRYDLMGDLVTMEKGTELVWRPKDESASAAESIGAQLLQERWGYDELGQRISHTNGAGDTETYLYDLRGNVVETTQPMGQKTRATFDAQGRKTGELHFDGDVTYWTYDYFGHLTGHTDLGGARYSYTYDHAQQLVAQANTRKQDLRYAYDTAGQLLRIQDNAIGQVTTYAYDLAGRHVREKVVQGGSTYQDNHLGYDEVGHLRDVADARVHITMNYDAVGNRVFIGQSVDYMGLNGDTTQTSSRYFQYDAMNRQTLVDGYAFGKINELQGHVVSYDLDGNRTLDRSYSKDRVVASGGPILSYDANGQAIYNPYVTYTKSAGQSDEVYTYDSLNRLKSVVRDGVQVDLRLYDAADRVIRSGSSVPGAYQGALVQGISEGESVGEDIRLSRYDRNGRLLHQRVLETSTARTKSDVGWDPTELMFGDFAPAGYDAAGNVIGYSVLDGSTGNLSQYTNQSVRFDGYRPSSTKLVATNGWGSITQAYDANGFLTSITDKTESLNNRAFVNDAEGRALFVNREGHFERQLIANGEVLGTYGAGIDPDRPFASGRPNFADLVDFDFGYAPISASYPNATPGTYVVRIGDTLRSIAQSAFGDSALWYLVAEANGLANDNDLRIGQTLNIPNRVSTIHNDSTTFKPYDPSRIKGDVTPNLYRPAADDGCGGVEQLFMIAIAVVVTIYTAGAVAGAMGASTVSCTAAASASTFSTGLAALAGGTATIGGVIVSVGAAAAITGAAVGAAAGSLVTQAVGMATDTRDRLDWKGVALSALSGGLSSGLAAGLVGSVGKDVVLRAAITNTVTQGIGVATGLQKSFNWRGVAASFIGAGASEFVRPGLENAFRDLPQGEFATRLGTGLAGGAAASVARGGRVAVQQVAVDAFGNALGESLASASNSALTTTADPLREFIDKNPPGWEQRQATFDQIADVFSQAQDGGRSPGVLVVDAGDVLRLSRPASTDDDAYYENMIKALQARDAARQAARASFRAGEASATSAQYASGAGDVRTTTSSAPTSLTPPSAPGIGDGYFDDNGEAWLPPARIQAVSTRVEPAMGPSFQEINDQRVIAGTYDRFDAIGAAWRSANWGDVWRHMTFVASPAARDAAISRAFPPQDPTLARVERLASSPIGATASTIGRVFFGANQHTQDALLATGTLAEQFAGAGTNVYKQTLTAPAPIPGVFGRGVRRQAGAFGGVTARTQREGMFLRNAEATFLDDSVFNRAIRFGDNIIIQRSDIEFSVQNVRRMAGGNSPYVKNAADEWEKVNVHHVGRQDGKLIEILSSHNIYTPATGGPLHIPGPGGPARDNFNVQKYWELRVETAIRNGQVPDSVLKQIGR